MAQQIEAILKAPSPRYSGERVGVRGWRDAGKALTPPSPRVPGEGAFGYFPDRLLHNPAREPAVDDVGFAGDVVVGDKQRDDGRDLIGRSFTV